MASSLSCDELINERLTLNNEVVELVDYCTNIQGNNPFCYFIEEKTIDYIKTGHNVKYSKCSDIAIEPLDAFHKVVEINVTNHYIFLSFSKKVAEQQKRPKTTQK